MSEGTEFNAIEKVKEEEFSFLCYTVCEGNVHKKRMSE